jgi:outer membrane protein TolC
MGRVIVLTLMVSSLAGAAAPAEAQDTLTLGQAVAEALARNPDVLAAQAAAAEADAGAAAARALFFPRVSFSESWQRSNQPVFAFSSLLAARQFTEADFAVDRLNHPGAVSAFAGRLVVSQVIFDGRTAAESSLGASRRDAASAAADAARASLAVEVTRAYGRVLTGVASEQAADSAVRAAEEDLARAERRRTAGMVTDADVLALAVHVAAMKRRQIAAAGDAAIARAALNRLTGAPVERTFAVQEPPPTAETPLDAAELAGQAEANRPELRQSAASVAAAEAGARLARAGWYPRVTAQAGYQFEGLEMFSRADSWIVGGEFTWGVSLGGAERARSRAAAAAVTAAEATHTSTRASVHLDVVTAVYQLEAARARMAIGSAAVEQAAERERITRNRYDAGLASVNDVLAAAAAKLDAEVERVAALVEALVASASLTRAVGWSISPSRP